MPGRAGRRQGVSGGLIEEYLIGLGIQATIPSKENEDRSARAVEFDVEAYRRRAIVENLIGWLRGSDKTS